MSALLELAERCEKATGPTADLDCAIFATVHPERFDDAEDAALYARLGWTRNRADWRFLRDIGMPLYTASIDAALTLVPEGWAVAEMKDGIRSDSGAYCHARLWIPLSPAHGYRHPANAATPALALCASALRARAADGGAAT